MSEKSERTMALAAGAVRLLLIAALAGAGTVSASVWQLGIVDPTGGVYPALRTDSYGNEHVAYVDTVNHILKYAFWDHRLQKWFTTPLDRSSGFCSLALDSKQFPHIAYIDYGVDQLKYAYWNGSKWQKQTVEIGSKDISYHTSIVLDSKDQPSISFYEYYDSEGNNDLHLRVVSWNGNMWQVRTADATHGSGKFNSMVIDSAGNLEMAYAVVSYENESLRYARWNGRDWETEILVGADGPIPIYSVSAILDSKDNPHITYTDVRTHEVKYATRHDGKWQFQLVDTLGLEAYPESNGIALDEQGNPYLSYCDAGRSELHVAYRKDQKWVAEIVERGFPCFSTSIQVDHGAILVIYGSQNSSGPLKFARRVLDAAEVSSNSSTGGQSPAISKAPAESPVGDQKNQAAPASSSAISAERSAGLH